MLAAFAVWTLVTRAAFAQVYPSCSSLPGNIVYIESGDTQENLLKVIGRQLRDTANITLVYELTGSCGITSDMYTNEPIVGGALLDYIPSTAENPSWDPTQPEENCTVDPNGAAVAVGIAALFVETCGLGDPPPVKARSVLTKGETRTFELVSLDAPRRRAELTLPGIGDSGTA